MVSVRFPYGPRERTVISDFGKDMCKQSFKAECDVNVIMKRFAVTGVLPVKALVSPQFGDVTGLDFAEMMNVIAQAQASFAALPAVLRKRFNNDPRDFVEFCSDESNVDEMVRMGLAVAKPPEVPPGDVSAPAAPVVAPVVPSASDGKKPAV